MISNEKTLELETRRQIYNVILKNPGLHLRELSRRIYISYGNFIHHLNFLTKQDFIVTKSDRRYTRYYVSKKVGREEKELLNILRQDIPRKIVLLLLSFGPPEHYKDYPDHSEHDPSLHTNLHSKKELAVLSKYWGSPYEELFNLKKHRTTIDFHLKKLVDANIVEKTQNGREIKYKIKEDLTIVLFLIKYKKTLSDPLVDQWLEWLNRSVEIIKDRPLDVIWEIFPHPYHA